MQLESDQPVRDARVTDRDAVGAAAGQPSERR
jgi:hypothetical protein